jgi:hypothetical protein
MLHPLLHLIATRPNLLADHAEAYADLVATQVGSSFIAAKRRAIYYAAALCSVAVMVWAVIPTEVMQAPWALVAVPLPTLLATIGCLVAARKPDVDGAFDVVRDQIKADVAMLRETGRL